MVVLLVYSFTNLVIFKSFYPKKEFWNLKMGSKKLFNLIADHFDLANRSPAKKKKNPDRGNLILGKLHFNPYNLGM